MYYELGAALPGHNNPHAGGGAVDPNLAVEYQGTRPCVPDDHLRMSGEALVNGRSNYDPLKIAKCLVI